jgi:hypothetical protein
MLNSLTTQNYSQHLIKQAVPGIKYFLKRKIFLPFYSMVFREIIGVEPHTYNKMPPLMDQLRFDAASVQFGSMLSVFNLRDNCGEAEQNVFLLKIT